MYYTHGDMIVYRSDRPERPPMQHRQQREFRRAEPSLEQALGVRITQLEERLARLEAGLEEARQAAASRPATRQGPGPRPAQAEDVRVSIHAEGGTQATLGQIRMLQDD